MSAPPARAMHLMLQQPDSDDYVVASGETHTVRRCCEVAFGERGLDYRDHVRSGERFLRPAEVDLLVGNAGKARVRLGWEPETAFSDLVCEMVRNDLELAEGEAARGKSPAWEAQLTADRR